MSERWSFWFGPLAYHSTAPTVFITSAVGNLLSPQLHLVLTICCRHRFLPSSLKSCPPASIPIRNPVQSKAADNSLLPRTMWHQHMALHAQSFFPGAVLGPWLQEQDLFICPGCQQLVANSHHSSHLRKCTHSSATPPIFSPPSMFKVQTLLLPCPHLTLSVNYQVVQLDTSL